MVCGLESEAMALGDLRHSTDISVGISGADPTRAEELAHHMCDQGSAALVSWGIAAGLSGSLRTGDLCVCTDVITSDNTRFRSDFHVLSDDRHCTVFGSEELVFEAKEKSRLNTVHQAHLLDMETHRVASVAVSRNVRWIAIRAISDESVTELPRLISDAIDAKGRPRVLTVLSRLLLRPHKVPAILKTKRDSDRAHEALRTSGQNALRHLLSTQAAPDFNF